MSNYRRTYLPGGAYFFTFVTLNHAQLFISEERVEVLRQAIRKVMAACSFEIEAMVVLPEHLHCIWRMLEGDADYSSRWREIKKATSRQISTATNACNERNVWQRRFWEHTIRDEEDWRNHLDYIHYNPVKHGLVSIPAAWPWSSFNRAVAKGWYEASWGASEPANLLGMNYE